jgi:hypothetical protein
LHAWHLTKHPSAQSGRLARKSRTSDGAFLEAVKASRWYEAQELLDKGAHVDEPNQDGTTPLIAMVAKNRTDWIIWLLARGADVDMADDVSPALPLSLSLGIHKQE